MLYKSYQVEENTSILKNKIALIYGENLGLIDDIKDNIIKENKHNAILKFSENQILTNYDLLQNEIKNISLFDNKKIILITSATDKLLKIIEEVIPFIDENKFFIFANVLEKKSKLRTFFEKDKKVDIIPCYNDNEISLKKIILNNLKGYKGLSSELINLLLNNCGNNRSKLKNEISKFKSFFIDKSISIEKAQQLLNLKEEDNFNIVRDNAFNGNRVKTNELLSTTLLEEEKLTLYLSIFYQRLGKLNEIYEKKTNNFELAVNELKPPIFWKEKNNLVQHAKKWNLSKLDTAFKKIFDVELKIKSSHSINKQLIIKKLVVDICSLVNAA